MVFSSWSDDPSVGLAEAVAEATGVTSNGSAVAALRHAQSERDVYLVLDQAEEYFLYHADDGGPGSFAEALPSILAAPSRVNVLVSLREDSLAKLDRFTGRVPGLFANTLRLDRLDRQAARAAIVGPVDRYGELTGVRVEIEPELVERVLDEVGAGRIETALAGAARSKASRTTARIEAPYLQLVMQRLWEEEREAGSSILRAATFERLGGAQRIVEEHFESAMDALSHDQKDIAARLFDHLVTPSGTKIAHELVGSRRLRARPARRASAGARDPRRSKDPPVARRGRRRPLRDLPRRPRGARGRLARESRGRAGARTAAGGIRPTTSATARDHRRWAPSCSR